MNRNQMFEYLKSLGLKQLFHHRDGRSKRNPKYHVEFVEDRDKSLKVDSIVLDWGYVRGFNRIHLCRDEIVLESDFGFTKINIKYNKIEKFEVVIYDEDEVRNV